jgi:aminoglycoside phosphotransferase (APT) family kinase protein
VTEIVSVLRTLPAFRSAELVGPPQPLRGGFWATISVLHLTGVAPPQQELVLRVMPDDALALKETVFQEQASAQGLAVPAVVLSGGREAGLGGPFLIMERAAGSAPLANLDGAAAIRRLPYLLVRLPALLAEVTAALHRLDPEPFRNELRAADPQTPTDLPQYLSALHEWAEQAERPDLVEAAEWLSAHRPRLQTPVVCHGDLHPFNILVEDGRWTLLDWTAAIIADPGYDLALTALLLRNPPLVAPPGTRLAIEAVGIVLARRFLAAYRATGLPVPTDNELHWYSCLHALRILLEVHGWSGSEPSRSGHPWNSVGPVAARHLSRATGVEVRVRSQVR